MQEVIDTETGQVFAFTSEDDEQAWYEDAWDWISDPIDESSDFARDVIGGWLSGDSGGGQGQMPQMPGGGGFGVPGGDFGIPGGGGGMQGGGGLPMPGGGGQMPAPGSGAPTGIESVPSQVAQWALRVFSQNPQWLKAIGRRLGILKGSPAHDTMSLTPGCVEKLAEQLPKAKREAVEQYMCGFPDAMGSADADTFLAIVIANSGRSASVCKCD